MNACVRPSVRPSVAPPNPNSRPFLVTTWYRPPKAPDECFDKFEEYLNLGDCKYKEIYILVIWIVTHTQIREIGHTPTELATNPKDIPDLLNVHFTEIGKKLASEIPEPPSGISFETYPSKTNTSFRLLEIDPSKILKLLTTVDLGKATGVDQISNKLLNIAAPHIYLPLANLFNLCIKTRAFPNELGIACFQGRWTQW